MNFTKKLIVVVACLLFSCGCNIGSQAPCPSCVDRDCVDCDGDTCDVPAY